MDGNATMITDDQLHSGTTALECALGEAFAAVKEFARQDDPADESLIATWGALDEAAQALGNVRGHIEMAITHRMDDRGAKELPHAEFEVKMTEGTPSWDVSILAGLREITSPDDLEGSYFPAHEETVQVPEKWNMTKAKTLARFGDEHGSILERARLPGPSRLRIKRKAEK